MHRCRRSLFGCCCGQAAHRCGRAEPHSDFRRYDERTVEVDFRGALKAVLHRLPQPAVQEEAAESETVARAPGRPKLGVTAREVTLLPRHWEWLAAQPGGASVALRKLVEGASRINETKDLIRKAQESTYRFMSAMAGNFPDYEEAVRALFAGIQSNSERSPRRGRSTCATMHAGFRCAHSALREKFHEHQSN